MMGGCGSKFALLKKDPHDASSGPKSVSHSGSKLAKGSAARRLASYPSLPMDKNGPRVRGFVREYAYKRRETMKRYLARAERYLPMVKAIAKENGLPEEIGYLFMLESGANPEARSPANALGMWQFMPATARNYGLRVDSWVDERLDPEKSTKAAMLYLKDLYGMFGCWRLALSAYNSGENKLNKVLCQEDANEYEEICSSRRLKRETREFWPRFQAMAQIAMNPRKYGFSPLRLRRYRGPKNEIMTVRGTYSLDTLAELVDVPTEQLAEINPGLIRGMTPGRPHFYSLRLPLGKRMRLAKLLYRTPTDQAGDQIVHVVHRKKAPPSRPHKRQRISRLN
ncbi:MAG: transglycosylase SLT domain-containing protein [Deltaproteobacteria bacterium]